MEETWHLNSHHRETLSEIFTHPMSHNIEWHDVVSLLKGIGTVKETHQGNIEVVVNGAVEVFDPREGKDIDADQLAILRRLLRSAGFGPEGEDT